MKHETKQQAKQASQSRLFCGECGGGVRMSFQRLNSTGTHRIFRCPYSHVFVQPIALNSGNTPDSAA